MRKNFDPTREGDVVLIYYQDKPAVYARIEDIQPDEKEGWFLVTLLFLTLPAQTITWILRGEYINGDPYTMGGQAIRLEKVKRTAVASQSTPDKMLSEEKKNKKHLRVIPFKKPNLD